MNKKRFHINEKHIPYEEQPSSVTTHTVGPDGLLRPLTKKKADKFKPSDGVPMNWGINYAESVP